MTNWEFKIKSVFKLISELASNEAFSPHLINNIQFDN